MTVKTPELPGVIDLQRPRQQRFHFPAQALGILLIGTNLLPGIQALSGKATDLLVLVTGLPGHRLPTLWIIDPFQGCAPYCCYRILNGDSTQHTDLQHLLQRRHTDLHYLRLPGQKHTEFGHGRLSQDFQTNFQWWPGLQWSCQQRPLPVAGYFPHIGHRFCCKQRCQLFKIVQKFHRTTAHLRIFIFPRRPGHGLRRYSAGFQCLATNAGIGMLPPGGK